MDRTTRSAAAAVRPHAVSPGKPLALGAAVAVGVAVTVGVTVALDRRAGAPAGADPAALYGRWVHSGDACDTRRGDMVIEAGTATHPGAITNHEGGVRRSKMVLAAVARKAPDSFEVKYTSANGEFVDFATFQLKDPATLVVTRYLFYPDAIWRKCPA